MKKIVASIFIVMLAFISFNVPSAMAVGDYKAGLIKKNGDAYHTIRVMKELYNSPSDSKVVNYVSPVQDVKVIRASFLIETWKGHKWVQFENLKVPASTDYPGQQRYNNDIQIVENFNASSATLKLTSRTYLYDSATSGVSNGDSLTPQTVKVRQAWYGIETWIGPKWIGYQLR